MESAIPDHLVCPRSRQRRIPDDFVPPYPSFVARHHERVTQVVMAYFGLQSRGFDEACRQALLPLIESFGADDGPGHWERSTAIDEAGFDTTILTAWWDDPVRFERWFERHGRRWTRSGPAQVGTFTEILKPQVKQYETLFSAPDRAEGIAALAEAMSGEVQEHAYWGGARDRIPASQFDAMQPAALSQASPQPASAPGEPMVVPGRDCICLIRSGQDWSDTDGDERRMYLDDVEPVLRAGMDYLRDHGTGIGCLSNRYLTVTDADGRALDKSYGMSWWTSLAALERWAESHPTHLAIFGAAMNYLSKLGPAARLKLYHEVSVAQPDEQRFEYRNCHDRTGMLAAGNRHPASAPRAQPGP